ncbi:DNA polymerase zeta catalytic subunit, putative, partial [Hepatocystis sp. ex Piliocolobus tephrosceles]
MNIIDNPEAFFVCKFLFFYYIYKKPTLPFDSWVCKISNKKIPYVCVIQILGLTLYGQSVCMYIHGFYPFFYVLIPPEEKGNKNLEIEICKFLEDEYGKLKKNTNENSVCIYNIERVKRRCIYGYKECHDDFLKIYCLYPDTIYYLASYLSKPLFKNRIWDLYEVHINYVLHFLCSKHIYGCSKIYVNKNIFFRKDFVSSINFENFIKEDKWDVKKKKTNTYTYGTESVKKKNYISADAPYVFTQETRNVIFSNLKKETSYDIECDILHDNILNQQIYTIKFNKYKKKWKEELNFDLPINYIDSFAKMWMKEKKRCKNVNPELMKTIFNFDNFEKKLDFNSFDILTGRTKWLYNQLVTFIKSREQKIEPNIGNEKKNLSSNGKVDEKDIKTGQDMLKKGEIYDKKCSHSEINNNIKKSQNIEKEHNVGLNNTNNKLANTNNELANTNKEIVVMTDYKKIRNKVNNKKVKGMASFEINKKKKYVIRYVYKKKMPIIKKGYAVSRFWRGAHNIVGSNDDAGINEDNVNGNVNNSWNNNVNNSGNDNVNNSGNDSVNNSGNDNINNSGNDNINNSGNDNNRMYHNQTKCNKLEENKVRNKKENKKSIKYGNIFFCEILTAIKNENCYSSNYYEDETKAIFYLIKDERILNSYEEYTNCVGIIATKPFPPIYPYFCVEQSEIERFDVEKQKMVLTCNNCRICKEELVNICSSTNECKDYNGKILNDNKNNKKNKKNKKNDFFFVDCKNDVNRNLFDYTNICYNKNINLCIVENEKELYKELINKINFYCPLSIVSYENDKYNISYINKRCLFLNIGSFYMHISTNNKLNDQYNFINLKNTHKTNIKGKIIESLYKLTNISNTSFENLCKHYLHINIPTISKYTLYSWYMYKEQDNLSESNKISVNVDESNMSYSTNSNQLKTKNKKEDTVFTYRYITIKYFLMKIHLLQLLYEKINFLKKKMSFCRYVHVDLLSLINRGSQYIIESFLLKLCMKYDYVLFSPIDKDISKQRPILHTPLILQPQSSINFSPLLVFDFQSLYPSIMIAFNICYSTCIGTMALKSVQSGEKGGENSEVKNGEKDEVKNGEKDEVKNGEKDEVK